MAIDDKIELPEGTKKIPPSERYVVLKRGEINVIEKRKYLLERALKKKTTEYATLPPYVHPQN